MRKVFLLIALNLATVLIARRQVICHVDYVKILAFISAAATFIQAPLLMKKDGGPFYIPLFATIVGICAGFLAFAWSGDPLPGDTVIFSLMGAVVGYVGALLLVFIVTGVESIFQEFSDRTI